MKLDEVLKEPQRQSRSAIVLFIYKFLIRMLRGFWPIILVVVLNSGNEKQSWYENYLNLTVAVAGLFSLVVSIVSYYKYFYQLDEEHLYIRQGVFNIKQTTLPFERIQNINIQQQIIHRMLNVVALKIDSAGSSGSEISIDALERGRAEYIRQYVLTKRRSIREAESPLPDSSTTATEGSLPIRSTIISLNLPALIRVGVSQNHLQTAGIILGSVFSFVFLIGDALNYNFVDEVSKLWPGRQQAYLISLVLTVMLVISAFSLTVFRAINRFYNLHLYEDREGFQLIAGLTDRRETAMRKEKIQLAYWVDNPIRRLFKIFTLHIRQAKSGTDTASERVEIPGCSIDQVEDVVNSSFPELAGASFVQKRMDKAYISWNFRFTGLIPLLAFGVVFGFTLEWKFLIASILFPLIAYFLLRTFYQRYRWWASLEFIKIKSGIFSSKTVVLPLYKIQAVELRSSFYQRRRKLANLVLHTAGGSETILFIPSQLADSLRDYILAKVEMNRRAWM